MYPKASKLAQITKMINKRLFLLYIASAEVEKLKKDLESVCSLSMMVDGGTESSITDVKLSYICYAVHGEVFVKFLAAKGLEKADASNVVDHAILGVAKAYLDLDKQRLARKLVGFGSNGQGS